MKLVFYGDDSAAGKARVAELRKEKISCQLIQAMACNEAEPFTELEFMPDVSPFHKARITALFGTKPTEPVKVEEMENPRSLKVGLGPGGKIYIREGSKIYSGPFPTQEDANEALRIALSNVG